MKHIAIALVVSLFYASPGPGTHTPARRDAVSANLNKNPMEAKTQQVVHNFLTAVQQDNHERAIALLHPNVVWNQPGSNRFSGVKTSRDELVQMIGGMTMFSAKSLRMSAFNQLSVNGNRAACVVHWQAVQEAGGRLDVDNIDVYTVQNGQITEAVVYSADIDQEDNFWSK